MDDVQIKINLAVKYAKNVSEHSRLLQFRNCRILRDHKIIIEDFWVRDGKIVDPEKVFFDEKISADVQIDCKGALICPGFIDLQINGGFGIDFSYNTEDVEHGLLKVAKGILASGVTAFCPTVVTSPQHVYLQVLPFLQKQPGGAHGATILGAHLEGPFINVNKKGAHPPECIGDLSKGFKSVLERYGSVDNARIVTLAPELENASQVIQELVNRGITVSLGHSMADLHEGENGVHHGATFITHLFNAMPPFHHRDPGLVGLLASDCEHKVYYGIIADGIHTHPAALRIAHRTHPDGQYKPLDIVPSYSIRCFDELFLLAGLVLVTDAISALGLEEGVHQLGQLAIQVRNGRATLAESDTLCGSIANMCQCIQFFMKAVSCSKVEALESATLHPAQALGIEDRKGTLDFGCDADFIFLGDDLQVWSTWIAGKCVFQDTTCPAPSVLKTIQ